MSIWKDFLEDLKRDVRKFLWFWLIGSIVVFVASMALWFWWGWPGDQALVIRTLLEITVISVVAPPVVWLIKVVLY